MDGLQLHPMEEIKHHLDLICRVIPSGSQIVYMDYPVHENIGDLLILKGTEAFFRDNGIRVRKRLSFLNFRKGMRIPPDWIIVCHGGGNFGDLYPANQQLRETLVADYPDHRIVVLPQTVYFRDESEQGRSLERFARHPDFHLFVRDERSRERAAGILPNVYLCPDMAHGLYPLQGKRGTGEGKTLGLLRTDAEAAEPAEPAGSSGHSGECDKVTDWPELFARWEYALLRIIVIAHVLDRYLGNLLPVRFAWYPLANRWVSKAVRLYGGYGAIITSRLHGHLLACLLNMPNRLIDNAYGKNESYFRLWTARVPLAGLASRPSPAAGKEGDAFAAEAGNHGGGMYAESFG